MSLLIIIACLLVISLTLNVYLLLRVRYQDNINQMYSEKIDRLWRFIEYRSIKAQGDRCSKFIMFFASYLENYNDEAYINCLNFKHSLCDIINSKVANISMLRDVEKEWKEKSLSWVNSVQETFENHNSLDFVEKHKIIEFLSIYRNCVSKALNKLCDLYPLNYLPTGKSEDVDM